MRGGAFFPEFTPVRLAGASLGGSFLKLRIVQVGFAIAFSIPVAAAAAGPDVMERPDDRR